jgi:hypothetical protein
LRGLLPCARASIKAYEAPGLASHILSGDAGPGSATPMIEQQRTKGFWWVRIRTPWSTPSKERWILGQVEHDDRWMVAELLEGPRQAQGQPIGAWEQVLACDGHRIPASRVLEWGPYLGTSPDAMLEAMFEVRLDVLEALDAERRAHKTLLHRLADALRAYRAEKERWRAAPLLAHSIARLLPRERG